MACEFVVQTRDLVRGVGLLISIVEKRHVIPILGNFRLEVKGNNLYITATDSDIEITHNIPIKQQKDGAVTVSALTFAEIIKKIPDEEVSLKYSEKSSKVTLSSSNCKFQLATIDANEFPLMREEDSNDFIKIKASDFSRLLEHTRFSMSNEETRYNLNGIYIHVEDSSKKVLHATATDCHRLSTSNVKLKEDTIAFGVIIPSKAVQELLKILKDSQVTDQEIKIYLETNRLRFESNNIVLKTKIIDGTFPEYQVFIPEGNEYKMKIDAKILAEVIDRVSTIIVDKFKSIKISCNSRQVELSASGVSGDAQEILTDHSCTSLSYSGPDVVIGFNPKYLLDVLHAVSGTEVTIELQDATSPVLIRSDKYPESQFIVMPVNI